MQGLNILMSLCDMQQGFEEFIFEGKENYLENKLKKGTKYTGKYCSPDRGKMPLSSGKSQKRGKSKQGEGKEKMEYVLGRNAERSFKANSIM